MCACVLLKYFISHSTLNTHTHPFNGPMSGTTRVSRYRKVKPIWILLEQETVNGSGISWAICKSAPRSRQITMPTPHHSGFLQAGCPSCRPTNSVKALKATVPPLTNNRNMALRKANKCSQFKHIFRWKLLQSCDITGWASNQTTIFFTDSSWMKFQVSLEKSQK